MTIEQPTLEEAKRAMASLGISEAVVKSLTGSGTDYVLPKDKFPSLALLQGEVVEKLLAQSQTPGSLTPEFSDDVHTLKNFAIQQTKTIYTDQERIRNQPKSGHSAFQLR